MRGHPPVIDFQVEKERRVEEAWSDYAQARRVAEETLLVSDGITAGKAWRRWLDLFMSDEQVDTLDRADNVVRNRFRSKPHVS